MRTSWCASRLAALLIIVFLEIGCGDVFRPVAVPQPTPPPDPGSLHFVLVISDNGQANRGAATRIDVSGDSNVGVQTVGVAPLHAALLPNGGRVYVANNAEDTISSYALGTVLSPATTSLPAGSSPVFVVADNSTVYVANAGANTVAVIPVTSNVVTNLVPVGASPIALAETPNATKVYAVNNGDGTVTSISGVNKAFIATILTGASPVWAAARSDSSRVYVLNAGSGTVSVIDTNADAVLCGGVSQPVCPSVGVGANFMQYDRARNRIYVTNPLANTVSVLDVSADPSLSPPNTLLLSTNCVVPGFIPPNCPATFTPVSVTVLLDGSRAYVASFQLSPSPCLTGQACTITSQVSVLDALSNTISTVIPLGTATVDMVNDTGCNPATSARPARFRVSVGASGDGSRVYAAVCDSGNTEIIRTSDNTLVTSADGLTVLGIPMPFSGFNPPSPVGGLCLNQAQQPPAGQPCNPPLQNPVLMLPGP